MKSATAFAQPPQLFQPSLFGSGLPSLAAQPTDNHRVELDACSWVEHLPRQVEGSDQLFTALLYRTAWRRYERFMFDQWMTEPRLHGDMPELTGASGNALAALRHWLEDRYQRSFDRGSLALYETGADSVAWHGDSLGRYRCDAVVAVLSLGADRRFALRPNPASPTVGKTRWWTVGGGDLLVMGGACQRDWQHSVPKCQDAGPRISVQFRSPGWRTPFAARDQRVRPVAAGRINRGDDPIERSQYSPM